MILKQLLLSLQFLVYHSVQGVQSESHLFYLFAVQGLEELPCFLQFFVVYPLGDAFDETRQPDGFCAPDFVNFIDDLFSAFPFLPGHRLGSPDSVSVLQLCSGILPGVLLDIDLVGFG